jgi:hypothetical protein
LYKSSAISKPSANSTQVLKNLKVDWHDYKFIDYESKRTGPGEQGASIEFDVAAVGYSGLLTDFLSVNRSLPDVRPAE